MKFFDNMSDDTKMFVIMMVSFVAIIFCMAVASSAGQIAKAIAGN